MPTNIEYTGDNSVLINSRDPAMAEIVTKIINGNRKLPLIVFTGLFSESIVSHAFTGESIIFFNPERKNL